MFNNKRTPQKHTRSSALNKTISDIKKLNSLRGSSKEENIILLNKIPNCTMNDYTKNISSTIFTPGVIP